MDVRHATNNSWVIHILWIIPSICKTTIFTILSIIILHRFAFIFNHPFYWHIYHHNIWCNLRVLFNSETPNSESTAGFLGVVLQSSSTLLQNLTRTVFGVWCFFKRKKSIRSFHFEQLTVPNFDSHQTVC